MKKVRPILIEAGIIQENQSFVLFNMGKKNNILEGGLYTQQVAICENNQIIFVHFFGRGLINRTYSIGQPITIKLSQINRVIFEKKNGYLWLELMIDEDKVSLSLSRKEWKTEEVKQFVNCLNSEFNISNYELYQKLK